MAMRRSVGFILSCALMLSTGCSFVAVRSGPPPRHCGVTFPLLDAAGVVTLGAMARASTTWPIVPGCDELECYSSRGEKNAEIAVLGVGAAIYAASSIYGFYASSQCAPPPALPPPWNQGVPTSVPAAELPDVGARSGP